MPSNENTKIDNAITKGMNTVDHPATLVDGECELLLNAFPGNPPEVRQGCVFHPGLNYGEALAPAKYLINSEVKKMICISKDTSPGSGVFYRVFSKENVNTDSEISYMTFSESVLPFFDMLQAHNSMYLIYNAPPASAWCSAINDVRTSALSHKVIEHDGVTIRDMCFMYPESWDSAVDVVSDYGEMTNGKFYCYTITCVRREDSAAFKAGTTPDNFILPAGMVNKVPQAIETYRPGSMESPESPTFRKVVELTTTAENPCNAVDLYLDGCGGHVDAIAQGATHLRVFRTQGQSSSENALGATKYWLIDLPIVGNEGSVFLENRIFTDTISDGALDGEKNTLFMDKYASVPYAKFAEFHNGRLWLYGILNKPGYGMYSEEAGGDDCTDLDLAIEYPQKYASMFKPSEYYVDCEHADGLIDTGIARLNNDLYFFKESKIFALYGGDPSLSKVENLSETIGCAFPFTITKCEVKGMFGNCILFMSRKGPYVLQAGGELNPFSRFKIKELWPDKSRELYEDLNSDYENIVRNCSAAFFKNTWWIFYKNAAGINRVFGYFFSNDLINEPNSPNGPFELSFAPTLKAIFKPVYLAIANDAEATLLCNDNNNIECGCNFLGNLNDNGSAKYNDVNKYNDLGYNQEYKIFSRRLYPGPKPESVSSFFSLVAMCHFEDDAEGNTLTFKVVSDYIRFNQAIEYIANQIINNLSTSDKTKFRNNIQVFGREGCYGTFFQYYLNKIIPQSGLFNFHRVELKTLLTNLDPEFLVGLGANNEGAITL